jgi:thioesterase domain-containing protein
MKGRDVMVDSEHLPEARRAVLEKYLRGDVPQTATTVGATNRPARGRPAPPSATDARVGLVPVQTGGSRRPLFYLHPHWIGGAFYTFTLAHHLGADQPLYLLDPYRFDGLLVPPTIEAMAAAYIEAMRTVQPHGPYLLAAFCGAGLIAYEMAQQLRAQGESVDSLLLVDPMAGPIRFIRLLGGAIRRTGGLLRLSEDKQVAWFLRVRYVSRVLRRSYDEHTEHVDRLLRRWRDEHPQRFALIPAAAALRKDWMAVFIWTVSSYAPRPYAGRITYLLAGDNPASRKLWWGAVGDADNGEIHTIPGTNTTCRTQHIHSLAERLRVCVCEAQGTEPRP